MKRHQVAHPASQKRTKLCGEQDPRTYIDPSLFGSIQPHPAFDPDQRPVWKQEGIQPHLLRALQGVVATTHPNGWPTVGNLLTPSKIAADLAACIYQADSHAYHTPSVTEQELSAFITIQASYSCLLHRMSQRVQTGIATYKAAAKKNMAPTQLGTAWKNRAQTAAQQAPYLIDLHTHVKTVWARKALWPQVQITFHIDLPRELIHLIVANLCHKQFQHQQHLEGVAYQTDNTQAKTRERLDLFAALNQ